MGVNGILLLDKDEGWTSQDCVSKLRGILGERRIGHAGTLDPLATGLLVVLVGNRVEIYLGLDDVKQRTFRRFCLGLFRVEYVVGTRSHLRRILLGRTSAFKRFYLYHCV